MGDSQKEVWTMAGSQLCEPKPIGSQSTELKAVLASSGWAHGNGKETMVGRRVTDRKLSGLQGTDAPEKWESGERDHTSVTHLNRMSQIE